MNMLLIWPAVVAVLAFGFGFALACLWRGGRQRMALREAESEWQCRVDMAKREVVTRTRMFEDSDSRRSTLQLQLDMAEGELLRAQDGIAELEGRWLDFGRVGRRAAGNH